MKKKIKNFWEYYRELRHTHGVDIATAMVIRNFRKKYLRFTEISNKENKLQYGKAIGVDDLFYQRFPHLVPILPSLPHIDAQRKINLMTLSLNGKHIFGGIATSLIFAMNLSTKMNIKLRIVCTDVPGTLENLSEFLERYNIQFDLNNVELFNAAPRSVYNPVHLEVRKDDIFIATTWWSAYLTDQLQPNNKFIYFVQDYEPIFSANGDEQVLANGTYLLKDRFIPIVNTKILHDYYVQNNYEEFSKHNLYFEPAFSDSIFTPRLTSKDEDAMKILFFYARPSVARNLFYLGLNSIKKAFDDGLLDSKKWEVYFAGAENREIEISKGFIAKNLGKMDIQDYGKFSHNVDLAISLMMAPHPSYPPLEMAASGARVVSTQYKNKTDLTNYSKNIFLADYSVESIIKKIRQTTEISETERIENVKSSHIQNNWNEAFEDVINKIQKYF